MSSIEEALEYAYEEYDGYCMGMKERTVSHVSQKL